MARITVSTRIARPGAVVWSELERLEDHATWMTDSAGIEFVGDQRRGVGTRIRVATRVGPLRTTDVLEFTDWEPPSLMGVTHHGLFGGRGTFRLTPDGDGTRFDWSEEIRFPWFLGGPLGAAIARPVLRRIWLDNLDRLRQRVESGP